MELLCTMGDGHSVFRMVIDWVGKLARFVCLVGTGQGLSTTIVLNVDW